jgi:2-polyprenyl-3-methyl-5-hydroxy-6-metoxy-1,4-benzoquinol methylase
MSPDPFCQLCDRTILEGEIYAQKDGWSYLRCPGCGLVLLHPIPDEATLRVFYNDGYEVDFERYAKNIRQGAESILRDLKKQFPNRGRLLEVGCSYGGFLAEARRDGWEVAGVELSETAACYARDKLNLRVFTGSLHDQLPQLGEPYEAVALFHVIEHVPDPVQLLEQCRKLIRPGGLLVLKTPNVASLIARLTKATWQWVSPPAHLYLYSPKTLALLLEKAGYQPIAYRSAQGDANNNLFAIMSSVAKRSILRSSGQPTSQLRKSLPVRIVERTCEFIYYPFGLSIDPWLESRLWQPELYAVASNAS